MAKSYSLRKLAHIEHMAINNFLNKRIMNKCLVTKLNGTVDNDSLMHIGEFRIKIGKVSNPTKDSQLIKIGVTSDTELRIVGDGYFTDSTLTQNKGKKITISRNDEVSNEVYVSNGDIELAVMNKYNLFEISMPSSKYNMDRVYDLDALKYSAQLRSLDANNSKVFGNLNSLSNCTRFSSIVLTNTLVTGNISVFADKNMGVVNLATTAVVGDISNLKNSSNLSLLNVSNTAISGDISILGNKNNLRYLSIANSGLYGDISAFRNNSNIKELGLIKLNCTGDLATLPDNILFIDNTGGSGKFSWGASTRQNILAMFNIKTDDVDKILNAMASMKAKFIGADSWYHTISLIGTRTSASDAAVATLQSKGYTVSVTPA